MTALYSLQITVGMGVLQCNLVDWKQCFRRTCSTSSDLPDYTVSEHGRSHFNIHHFENLKFCICIPCLRRNKNWSQTSSFSQLYIYICTRMCTHTPHSDLSSSDTKASLCNGRNMQDAIQVLWRLTFTHSLSPSHIHVTTTANLQGLVSCLYVCIM